MNTFNNPNLDPNEPMVRSWLIQRISKPTGVWNPFSFGGGGGHFQDKLKEMTKSIYDYDYMGAAEFEWGAVPVSLGWINQHAAECVAGVFQHDVGHKYPIFYIVHRNFETPALERLYTWAMEPYSQTKEVILLHRVLTQSEDEKYPSDIVGWHELNNHWMFFIDEEMWRASCEMLGVKVL